MYAKIERNNIQSKYVLLPYHRPSSTLLRGISICIILKIIIIIIKKNKKLIYYLEEKE
jgi:hypothetical protein